MSERLSLRMSRRLKEYVLYVKAVIKKTGPAGRFVIFGPGRSGSTLLVGLLNSNPQIQCDGEILQFTKRSPRRYIEASSKISSFPWYGFKMQHNHLEVNKIKDEKSFINDLHEDGWKFIFLHRGNFLKQALSLEIARARQQWFSFSANEHLPKVRLNPDDLLARMEQLKNSFTLYEELLSSINYLEINYELDLISQDVQSLTLEKVAQELKVPNRFNMDQGYFKTVSSVRSSVQNWEDILHTVAQSDFASLDYE